MEEVPDAGRVDVPGDGAVIRSGEGALVLVLRERDLIDETRTDTEGVAECDLWPRLGEVAKTMARSPAHLEDLRAPPSNHLEAEI
ncbi:MAG: hypothetical protein L6Q76_34435 [Polyangiaceae bacterium]|nr:hypothetical protein [Polyangiaceae bacterium]